MAALFKILLTLAALFAIAYAMPAGVEAEKVVQTSSVAPHQEVSQDETVKIEETHEAKTADEVQHSREKRACRTVTIGTRRHGSWTAGKC